MDRALIKLARDLNQQLLKLGRSLPIPSFLTSAVKKVPKSVGRVLPPPRAGARLASGAPPLPSHMSRAKTLMKDESYRNAAQAAAGGELRNPTALLAMGLRGSGGKATPALGTLNRLAGMPKQTVGQAGEAATSAVEAGMAQRAAKLRAARAGQVARGA